MQKILKALPILLETVSNLINEFLVQLQTIYNEFNIICLVQNERIKNKIMSIVSPINFLPENHLPDIICLHEDKDNCAEIKIEEERGTREEGQEEQDQVCNEENQPRMEGDDEEQGSSSESQPENQNLFVQYLKRRVLKHSRNKIRRSMHISKVVNFKPNGTKVKSFKRSSDYTEFTSLFFKFLRDKKIKIGLRSSNMIGQIWSQAQTMGIKNQHYEEFIGKNIKTMIKSIYQGEAEQS